MFRHPRSRPKISPNMPKCRLFQTVNSTNRLNQNIARVSFLPCFDIPKLQSQRVNHENVFCLANIQFCKTKTIATFAWFWPQFPKIESTLSRARRCAESRPRENANLFANSNRTINVNAAHPRTKCNPKFTFPFRRGCWFCRPNPRWIILRNANFANRLGPPWPIVGPVRCFDANLLGVGSHKSNSRNKSTNYQICRIETYKLERREIHGWTKLSAYPRFCRDCGLCTTNAELQSPKGIIYTNTLPRIHGSPNWPKQRIARGNDRCATPTAIFNLEIAEITIAPWHQQFSPTMVKL